MKIFGYLFLISIFLCSCVIERKMDVQNQLLLDKVRVLERDTSILSPTFISLPLGAVRPEGWLEDQAKLALNGITGHLDEYSVTHLDGWGGNYEKGTANTGWILEQSAYWLDGAIRLSHLMNDIPLFTRVAARLDTIVQHSLENNSTLIFWKPRSEVLNSFSSWSHSHIARAMLAYYQATGNKNILNAIREAYASFPIPDFPYRYDGNVSGIVNIDPMFETYLYTADADIMNNIRTKVCSDAYMNVIDSLNINGIPVGHGVIMYENFRIPAITYLVTKDRKHLSAVTVAHNKLENNHMLPCGIVSSEEWLAGIGSTRNIETCNITAASLFYQSLYNITGDGKYGDRLEQIFFNAAPVGVSSDYKNVIYYQSHNKIDSVLPGEYPSAPMDIDPIGNRVSSYEYSPLGHHVLCCVGNSTRILPNYIMNMWARTNDKGIVAMLYGPNCLRTIVGEDNVHLQVNVKTDYPFSDDLLFYINPENGVTFPLYLRIPAWAVDFFIEVNGEPVKYVMTNGFAVIDRKWNKGDIVNLILKREICIDEGYETDYPDVDYHKKQDCEIGRRELASLKGIHNPYETISYGPLLFAYPIPEKNLNEQQSNIEWRYALNIKNVKSDVRLFHYDMPLEWSWEINKAPVVLEVKAKLFDWKPTPSQPLPETKVVEGKDVNIRLVPYGCTHYRISMFPVTK